MRERAGGEARKWERGEKKKEKGWENKMGEGAGGGEGKKETGEGEKETGEREERGRRKRERGRRGGEGNGREGGEGEKETGEGEKETGEGEKETGERKERGRRKQERGQEKEKWRDGRRIKRACRGGRGKEGGDILQTSLTWSEVRVPHPDRFRVAIA